MGIDELRGWLAYTRDHPLPDPWLQHGALFQLLLALHGKKSKITDFIPVVPATSARRTGIDWAAVSALKSQARR